MQAFRVLFIGWYVGQTNLQYLQTIKPKRYDLSSIIKIVSTTNPIIEEDIVNRTLLLLLIISAVLLACESESSSDNDDSSPSDNTPSVSVASIEPRADIIMLAPDYTTVNSDHRRVGAGGVVHIEWSPVGNDLAVSTSRSLFLYPDGDSDSRVQLSNDWLVGMTFSPDGTQLATLGREGVVVYSMTSFEEVARIPIENPRFGIGHPQHPIYSEDSSQMAVVNGSTITFYDTATFDEISSTNIDADRIVNLGQRNGAWIAITSTEHPSNVLRNGTGPAPIEPLAENPVALIDIETGEVLATYTNRPFASRHATLIGDDGLLVMNERAFGSISSRWNAAEFYPTPDGDPIPITYVPLEGAGLLDWAYRPENAILTAVYNVFGDGNTVAFNQVIDGYTTLAITWDINDGSILGTHELGYNRQYLQNSIAFNASGTLFAAVSGNDVGIFDASANNAPPIDTYSGYGYYDRVMIEPGRDVPTLLARTTNGTFHEWNLDTSTLSVRDADGVAMNLPSPSTTNIITNTGFLAGASTDELFATASGTAVVIRDTETNATLHTRLFDFDPDVIAFSNNTPALLLIGTDGSIVRWDYETDAVVEILEGGEERDFVQLYLTPADRYLLGIEQIEETWRVIVLDAINGDTLRQYELVLNDRLTGVTLNEDTGQLIIAFRHTISGDLNDNASYLAIIDLASDEIVALLGGVEVTLSAPYVDANTGAVAAIGTDGTLFWWGQ